MSRRRSTHKAKGLLKRPRSFWFVVLFALMALHAQAAFAKPKVKKKASDAAKTKVVKKDTQKASKTTSDDAKEDPKSLKKRIATLEAKLLSMEKTCTHAQDALAKKHSHHASRTDEVSRRVKAMRPAQAAQLIAVLEPGFAKIVFDKMDRRTAARILNKMPVAVAARLLQDNVTSSKTSSQ